MAEVPETIAKGAQYGTGSDSRSIFTSPPSSSTIKSPFISSDMFPIDLVSGNIPIIKPI
ncbi:hypothetical protein Lalb_Chr04g0251651 [Lupinus albus]|uniref:Uncharacterized protein n=1 Tax=Lupinus albus TaxID=3870 RepID=A0A6A4QN88_LUPAL|nr:hypothetical protein Lalb_Chr04g0251651 [Lupinus albus]